MKYMTFFTCCFAVAATLTAFAHEPGAHVHGVGKLQVTLDANTLTLGLESPLDNLLGFEHLPRNDQQKAAVRAMADKLKQPATLFVTTPAAQCKVDSVKLESPVLEPAKMESGDGHADLDGEFVFRCAQPAALHDIEVRLFAAFSHLQRLDVEIIGPRGQTAARLTAKQPRISW